MSPTLLIVIGTAVFALYIFYTIFFHKSSTAKPVQDEIVQDLQVINKMKEFQLIKEAKQIQTLEQKEGLFKRAYANRYGEQALHDAERNLQQTEEILHTETEDPQSPDFNVKTYDNEKQFAEEFYRSVPEPSNQNEYITEKISGEHDLTEHEYKELDAAFKDLDFSDIAAETLMIDPKRNLPAVFHHKERSIFDPYTEEELQSLSTMAETLGVISS